MTDNTTQDIIFYDHPLTERIRIILRAHYLLHQSKQCLHREDSWGSFYTLQTLAELLLLLERHDVRLELQKEYDRINTQLYRLKGREEVNESALTYMLDQLSHQLNQLSKHKDKFGYSLQHHYLLQGLKHKQQARICNSFELPILHQWLYQSYSQREYDLQQWLGELEPLDQNINFLMQLFRDCCHTEIISLKQGHHQRTLEPQRYYPLIRLGIPAHHIAFPEISANRHCINIRLLVSSQGEKPLALKQTVDVFFMQCGL
ncbi:Z ring-associated protein D [Piscirickettsia salmonis]|uniref:Cell division protein ZapD n=1 Tax=Piscirickettsia salmonis TaxID=1238 RepID=A0A1L6TEW8_PISSA|nr:cell division protein ZapD [Piscirickettsia salmonis]AKP72497.1 cell division protein ZapD [Piscirickettsia salmonis LF-89 = ATCC VR-1361]ALB24037.1 Cell division protein ZapD [Piscirickettsia salmonis]ALY03851.1 cell division protein ZapD [Piscirickettsia salmonis]AMA43414.1 cell division protein ZapD [Piscirickettsia salmonis]AOS35883.1 cell division protein ZapD [Piscirickettsia salmonis]